jgi:short subunit dehydrogenase-like uncharacterized protein
MQAASYVMPLLLRLPFIRRRLRASAQKALQTTGQGPDAAARSRSETLVIAVASDASGQELATARLRGGDAYEFTGRIMSHTACRLAAGDVPAAGALGPVDLFGLDDLERAGADAGLRRA